MKQASDRIPASRAGQRAGVLGYDAVGVAVFSLFMQRRFVSGLTAGALKA